MGDKTYDEVCPGCNKKMTWDNDMDWYCIDGKPTDTVYVELGNHYQALDDTGLEFLVCPHCKTLVAISAPTTAGQDLFINSDCLNLSQDN